MDLSHPNAGVAFAIILNIVCSVSIIATNKVIFSVLAFRFVMFLSAVHFFTGALFLQVLSKSGVGAFQLSKESPPPRDRMIRLAFAGATSIVAVNFSLRFNAMGTYQIMKTAVLPAVMIISYYQGKTAMPDRRSILSATCIVLGSCFAVLADMAFTTIGATVGILGILLTAQYQIWGSSEQKDLGLTPSQVMIASSFPQAFMTFAASIVFESSLFTPFFSIFFGEGEAAAGSAQSSTSTAGALPDNDNNNTDLLTFPWTLPVIGYILLSAVFAVGLNWSSFAIMGKTSATTMQVVNQVKTILIVAADFVFFPKDGVAPSRALIFGTGILMVVGGATYYGMAPASTTSGGTSSSSSSSSFNTSASPSTTATPSSMTTSVTTTLSAIGVSSLDSKEGNNGAAIMMSDNKNLSSQSIEQFDDDETGGGGGEEEEEEEEAIESSSNRQQRERSSLLQFKGRKQ